MDWINPLCQIIDRIRIGCKQWSFKCIFKIVVIILSIGCYTSYGIQIDHAWTISAAPYIKRIKNVGFGKIAIPECGCYLIVQCIIKPCTFLNTRSINCIRGDNYIDPLNQSRGVDNHISQVGILRKPCCSSWIRICYISRRNRFYVVSETYPVCRLGITGYQHICWQSGTEDRIMLTLPYQFNPGCRLNVYTNYWINTVVAFYRTCSILYERSEGICYNLKGIC